MTVKSLSKSRISFVILTYHFIIPDAIHGYATYAQ